MSEHVPLLAMARTPLPSRSRAEVRQEIGEAIHLRLCGCDDWLAEPIGEDQHEQYAHAADAVLAIVAPMIWRAR